MGLEQKGINMFDCGEKQCQKELSCDLGIQSLPAQYCISEGLENKTVLYEEVKQYTKVFQVLQVGHSVCTCH